MKYKCVVEIDIESDSPEGAALEAVRWLKKVGEAVYVEVENNLGQREGVLVPDDDPTS